MSWFRVDDGFPDHPKLQALERDRRLWADALALWLAGGCYCRRVGTGGFISDERLLRLAPMSPSRVREVARALVEDTRIDPNGAGLWERVDGGYQIHDYAEYGRADEREEEPRRPPPAPVKGPEPTGARARAKRYRDKKRAERDAARQAAQQATPEQRDAAPVTERDADRDASRVTEGVTERDASRVTEGVTERDASRVTAHAHTGDPTRPDPTRDKTNRRRRSDELPVTNRDASRVTEAVTERDASRAPEGVTSTTTTTTGRGSLHAVEAASEAAEATHSDRLFLAASSAYGRALEGAGAIFDGAAAWRSQLVAVGRLAERVAQRDARPMGDVLAEWARRYVTDRRSRRPDWWLERVTAWAAEGTARTVDATARRIAKEDAEREARWQQEELEAAAPPPELVRLLKTGQLAERRLERNEPKAAVAAREGRA